MVTEGGPAQHGGDNDHHQVNIQAGNDGHRDGNHNTHGAPRSTGGEGNNAGDHKNGSGNGPRGELGLHNAGQIGNGALITDDAADGPGQNQDANGNNHRLKALHQGIHGNVHGEDSTDGVEGNSHDYGGKAGIGQGDGRIGVPEGFKESDAPF